jgi:hypothetical protein
MKTISLLQPWASLVATGAKKIETRSWPTKYRGLLAIHASKGWGPDQSVLLSCWEIQGGLAPLVGMPLDFKGKSWHGVKEEHLPRGFIIATCILVDCIRTDDLTQAQIGTDRPFGDFSLGRFAWLLEDVKVLPEPIPAKGKLGLWESTPYNK